MIAWENKEIELFLSLPFVQLVIIGILFSRFIFRFPGEGKNTHFRYSFDARGLHRSSVCPGILETH